MNGQNVVTPRKALYGCMIWGLVLSAIYLGNARTVRAQEAVTETPAPEVVDAQVSGLEAAMISALDAHRTSSTDEYYYRLLTVTESGQWGAGEAEKIRKDTHEVIPADFSIILARRDENGNWRVVLPNEAGAYLELLGSMPDLLLNRPSKEHIREAYSLSAQITYSDHYLPWSKGSAAVVYQNYAAHGEGQLDFGFSESIRTSKTGALIFAYDAHTWSGCTGQTLSWCYSNYPHAWYYNNAVVIRHADGEYSAYLHMQTDSIPAAIMDNCNSGNGGNCAAVNIPAGTIIGTVGSVGLSTGAHLHFGTGNYIYGRCDYPDEYDEDGDGDTTETNICTGGITGDYGISTSFHEKPYSATNCGTGAGEDPTLCMLYYPTNTDLVSQNPGGGALGKDIITNGDFENPAVASNRFTTYRSGQVFGNWTVESGSVDQVSALYWQGADGGQSVDLNGEGPGAIFQPLNTVPSQEYLLRFALAGNPETRPCSGAVPIKTMEVWWGATLVDTLRFDVTGHSNWDMGWTFHQYAVTATDTITRLMFRSLAPSCYGPVLDMVSVPSFTGTYRIFQSAATDDGWVLESAEASNRGGTMNAIAATFRLGDDVGDRQYRSILSFRTGRLPNNAVISRAMLKIKKQGTVGTNPFNTHGGLKVDIGKPPYFGGSAGLAISDFQASAGKAAAATFNRTPAAGAWYSAVLSPAAYPYISLTGTTQFRLRFAKDDNDDLGADYLVFYSGNALTASYRPVLVIEYYVP